MFDRTGREKKTSYSSHIGTGFTRLASPLGGGGIALRCRKGGRVKLHCVQRTRQEPLGSLKNSHFAQAKPRFLRLGGRGAAARRLPAWTVPSRFSPWRKRLPAEGGEAAAGPLRRGAGPGQAPVTASRCRAGTRPRSGRRRRSRPWRCSPASSSPRPGGPRNRRRAVPSPGYSPLHPAGP